MKEATNKIYDNLHFTHKIHEKQCELLSLGTLVLRLLSVILICGVLFLQFWQLIDTGHERTLVAWSIVLTVAEVGLVFFQLNFNYDKLLDQHRTTAKSLLIVKNRLIVAKASGITQKLLGSFVDELNEIYSAAPQTNRLAKWLVHREGKRK